MTQIPNSTGRTGWGLDVNCPVEDTRLILVLSASVAFGQGECPRVIQATARLTF